MSLNPSLKFNGYSLPLNATLCLFSVITRKGKCTEKSLEQPH